MAKTIKQYFSKLLRKSDSTRDTVDMDGGSYIKELEEAIKQYAKFRLDGPLVKHACLGMHEETIICRAAIHDMVGDLAARGIAYDTTRLKALDKEWQSWISTNKTKGFEVVDLSREDEPKSEWWFWIDHLEDLTASQRSTI